MNAANDRRFPTPRALSHGCELRDDSQFVDKSIRYFFIRRATTKPRRRSRCTDWCQMPHAPAARAYQLLTLLLLSPATAAAQGVELGTVRGQYDDVANCLLRSLPATLKGWPTVYAPPRQDAILNIYHRGNDQGVDPVAVLSIRGDGSGSVRVSLMSGAAEHEGMARSAVRRCTR